MKPLPNGAVITARNSVNNASGLWKSNIGKLFCDTFTGFQNLSMNHSWFPENVFDCNLSRRFHICCRILGLFDAFYLKRSMLDRGDSYHAAPCARNALNSIECPNLPIGYVRLSLGPQDPRGPPTSWCGMHGVQTFHHATVHHWHLITR